jgi:1,4-alpha-glucan branching enzyme
VDLEGTSWVELAAMEVPPELAAVMGEALDAARLLGQRTGELHLAFASDATDPAFAPEPITPGDLERLAEAIGDQVRRALATLRVERDRLPLDVQVEADRALAAEPIFLERLQALANLEPGSTRIRCHGDYHLGQVLRAGGDFVLLDFEGEPAKTLAERVAKQPPLKDVVGMIRSFDYAAFAALFKYLETRPESRETLIPSARAWRTWTAAAFLRRYFETTAEASFLPANPDDVRTLLDALLLDKSLYELLYELNNRPDWVRIPLQGIVALAEERPDGQGERSLTDFDIHLLAEGRHYRAFEKLGAHPTEQAGVPGVQFAVWAPGAKSVAVVGEWNDWNPRAHPMRARGQSGYWERFISDVPLGSCYKYAITSRFGDYRIDKADPYAFASEVRPGTASVVVDLSDYAWNDHNWCDHRDDSNQLQAPISIYEVHLGSWMRHEDGRWLSYREVAPRLAAYVQEMGFTHVELMPLAEHPFDGSWGYQVTAYFAATSRFGTPQDLMYLVDTLHQAEIGVILDWVPAHFPDDAHGLSFFDGTHLYEHPDKRRGFHQDWNTFIFNFGRPEVANFLVSSALFWLETYHLDGLRVDAVASMLYLDYSRKPGQWLPNDQGGRENFEAIALLRLFNEQVHAQFPDVLTIAEESTSWPMVTRPTSVGGLGFDLKWDLGWMHDTLEYLSRDPIERKHHHGQLTFRGIYAFSENFVLPLSHDEVVYGKRSLLAKMPGNTWQKFANLRLLLGYQYALPGKKLMFMGDELGTWVEWNHDAQLDWSLLEFPAHAGLKRWVRDLNDLYRDTPELHELDVNPDGFQWVVTEDSEQSVIAFTRKGDSPSATILIIVNFTPVPRHNYRIGVEQAGEWGEILNSDATIYGGSGQGNLGGAVTSPVSSHGHPRSLNLTLPPLALVMLRSP